jgi:hypothetical protein
MKKKKSPYHCYIRGWWIVCSNYKITKREKESLRHDMMVWKELRKIEENIISDFKWASKERLKSELI